MSLRDISPKGDKLTLHLSYMFNSFLSLPPHGEVVAMATGGGRTQAFCSRLLSINYVCEKLELQFVRLRNGAGMRPPLAINASELH